MKKFCSVIAPKQTKLEQNARFYLNFFWCMPRSYCKVWQVFIFYSYKLLIPAKI